MTSEMWNKIAKDHVEINLNSVRKRQHLKSSIMNILMNTQQKRKETNGMMKNEVVGK